MDPYDQTQWANFLAEFSRRNRSRRARFEQFDRRGVEEEDQEAHLESVTVELGGADAARVIVTRLDTSTAEPRKIIATVTDVKRISPRLDRDGSEDGLEMEDSKRVLTILRMESLLDGAS